PSTSPCVLNRQPTWAKITQTVHEKGQRAESKDQRADMCTDEQPRTSSTNVLCVLADTHRRPVCTEQPVHVCADMCTDGQTRTCVLTDTHENTRTATDVPCVLMDTHERPVCADGLTTRLVCADGHTQTHTDSHGHPVQPTWAKITQTVHGKGQRAESKDQRANMCTDGQPRTSYVLFVLTDTHGRPVCTEQTAHVGKNHPNSPREGLAC
ncbi:unnamed protein product, partial [Brassica rapa]